MDASVKQPTILVVDDTNPDPIAELLALFEASEHLKDIEIVRVSELVANGGTRTLIVDSEDVIQRQVRLGEGLDNRVLIVGPGGIMPTLQDNITEVVRRHHLMDQYIPTLSIGPAHDGLPNRDRWGKQRPPRRNHKKSKRR